MSIKYALLGLIQERETHGYELLQEFHVLVGGSEIWDLKPAQAYSTLKRLEQDGDIEAHGTEGEERLVYQIRPQGQAKIESWLLEPIVSQTQRDDFFVKLMLCLRICPDRAEEIIFIQRTSLLRELHDLQDARSATDKSSNLALLLHLDQASLRIEADLRWLELVELRLDEIRAQGLPKAVTRSRGRPRKPDKEL